MKKSICRGLSLLMFAGLFSTVVGCEKVDDEPVLIRPVRTIVVGSGTNSSSRTYNGHAQTDRIINLSFRSTGIITVFDIKLGQRVNKGDLLAELDNVAARLAYEQAVSSRNSAKSDLNTKTLNLARVRSLYEKGGVSLSEYESAKNGFQTAEASFMSSKRSVEIQQEQIRYGRIIAPESGVIAAVMKEVDENVAAGETVAVLNAGAGMKIEVGLPESVINLVQAKSQVTVTFAALPGEVYAGQISEVSPAIDRNTATYPVRLELLGSTEKVRAGMAASVTFDFDNAAAGDDMLLVPASAVGEDAEGQFVFTVARTPEQIALVRKQRIEIGSLLNNSFEVVSGLSKGDLVITAGVHSVLDGQQVRVQ